MTHKEAISNVKSSMRLQVVKLEDYAEQFDTQTDLSKALGKAQSAMSLVMQSERQYYVVCMLDGPKLFHCGKKGA